MVTQTHTHTHKPLFSISVSFIFDIFVVMSEDQRWAALLSCFFVGSVTGMQYAFSVYSDALKDLYDLKQSQVSTFYVFFLSYES